MTRHGRLLALLLGWALTLPCSAQEPPPAAAEGDEERVAFFFTFPEERGGGTAAGFADVIELDEDDVAVLHGNVEVLYQDMRLRAHQVEMHRQTKLLRAQGDVLLDQGPARLSGQSLSYDLETKTGTVTEASASVAPDFFFRGDAIAKVGEDVYTVEDGTFTSCSDRVPDWSFHLGKARIKVGGYARVRNASMKLKNVPVFFTPYLLWPVKRERSPGFLIPNVGFSETRGSLLGLAYYQTLGRSYDTTFFVDLWTEEFVGLGNELRYRPSEGTEGSVLGYAVWDPFADRWRWKLQAAHQTTDLPWDMRGVVEIREYSDFDFLSDFERDLDRNNQRSFESRAFVTGNWGPHSLNFLATTEETLTGARTIQLRQLPEIEYRLRSTKLGPTPLYLELLSSLNYIAMDRSETLDGSYGRFDLFPRLTLPLRTAPWLSLSVSAGGRLTFWSDSLEAGNLATFGGESLSRSLPVARAEVIGPSFSKIFKGRYKHVVEPRWTYDFIGDIDDVELVPLFDQVDSVRATNVGRFALINRLLAKPAGGGNGSAREILSFEIAQNVSFDDDQPLQRSADRTLTRLQGPVTTLLRFHPSPKLSLDARTSHSTLFDRLESSSLSGSYAVGPHRFRLTWFTNILAEDGRTLSNQARLAAGITVLPERLRLETFVNYDIRASDVQDQRYVIHYTSQCFGLRFEVFDSQTGAGDTELRFSVDLKKVGTFLDLTGRY